MLGAGPASSFDAAEARRLDALDLVALAATPGERRSAAWLEPVGGDVELQRVRRRMWVDQIADGDEATFAGVLAARGLDERQAGAGLREVVVAEGQALPRWAETLGELLAETREVPDPQDVAAVERLTRSGEVRAGGMTAKFAPGTAATELAPVHALVRRRLESNGATHGGTGGMPAALCAALCVELLIMIGPGLVGLGQRQPGDTRGAWRSLFGARPALARPVALLIDNLDDVAQELATRVEADRDELERTGLMVSQSPWATMSCRPVGDRHSGRCTMAIGEGGVPAVYLKPRDLRAADALDDLFAAVGLSPPLPARLVRDGYGWERAVAPRLPAHDGEWDSLAGSVGRWLRVLTLLGSVDMHRENVVICGPDLVPIDVETLLSVSPWSRGIPEPSGIRATGLLRNPLLPEPSQGPSDLGLLGAEEMRPLLDRTDAIVDGYTAMHARLVAHRGPVLRAIAAFGSIPTRMLVRSSMVYARLLVQSLGRSATSDGVQRELVLERLWRAHWRSGLSARIVEEEVEAIRQVDIPRITFRPDAALPGGDECAASVTPLAAVRSRLHGLHATPDPAEIAEIRSLVSAPIEA